MQIFRSVKLEKSLWKCGNVKILAKKM